MAEPTHVVLATGNPDKAREFGRLLAPTLAVEPLPASVALPEETGSSFAANARLKAESVAEALGWSEAVLADDSGLEVVALGGRPGVLSARYAGEAASDAENVSRLLADLGDRPQREARFVCALCLSLPDLLSEPGRRRSIEVEGVLGGRITKKPRGVGGFGYDPVFQPDGWSRTLAEVASGEKDRVSHRGAACRELLKVLASAGSTEGEDRGGRGL